MGEYLQVFTTTAAKEEAERMARALVERRLVACAQVLGPITSTYRWQGRVEVAQEWLLLLKTKRALYGELERAIRELHPYEVPEIVAVPVTAGSQQYLEWLEGALKGGVNAPEPEVP